MQQLCRGRTSEGLEPIHIRCHWPGTRGSAVSCQTPRPSEKPFFIRWTDGLWGVSLSLSRSQFSQVRSSDHGGHCLFPSGTLSSRRASGTRTSCPSGMSTSSWRPFGAIRETRSCGELCAACGTEYWGGGAHGNRRVCGSAEVYICRGM